MNRSPAECLQQFIKMPLNETILERINMHSNCLLGKPDRNINFEPCIFGDIEHPILSQVAIFAKSLQDHSIEDALPEEENSMITRRSKTQKPMFTGKKRDREDYLLERDMCEKIKEKSIQTA